MTAPSRSTVASPWPYPLWIAHRGAGKLAPENTLAAFRLGAALERADLWNYATTRPQLAV